MKRKPDELLAITQDVKDAFSKVFNGSVRSNIGDTDNHCSKETLEHFLNLYNGDLKAIDRENAILAEMKHIDFDTMGLRSII